MNPTAGLVAIVLVVLATLTIGALAMRWSRTNSTAASRTGSGTEDAGRLPATTLRRSLSISASCDSGRPCWAAPRCESTSRVTTVSCRATQATNTTSAGMAHHMAVSRP